MSQFSVLVVGDDVVALVPKNPMESFLEQILAGRVDVRRAYTIQRYEIVPKGKASELWPAIHAFVSIDTQDGTVYATRIRISNRPRRPGLRPRRSGGSCLIARSVRSARSALSRIRADAGRISAASV